jgi:hypothetical protein
MADTLRLIIYPKIYPKRDKYLYNYFMYENNTVKHIPYWFLCDLDGTHHLVKSKSPISKNPDGVHIISSANCKIIHTFKINKHFLYFNTIPSPHTNILCRTHNYSKNVKVIHVLFMFDNETECYNIIDLKNIHKEETTLLATRTYLSSTKWINKDAYGIYVKSTNDVLQNNTIVQNAQKTYIHNTVYACNVICMYNKTIIHDTKSIEPTFNCRNIDDIQNKFIIEIRYPEDVIGMDDYLYTATYLDNTTRFTIQQLYVDEIYTPYIPKVFSFELYFPKIDYPRICQIVHFAHNKKIYHIIKSKISTTKFNLKVSCSTLKYSRTNKITVETKFVTNIILSTDIGEFLCVVPYENICDKLNNFKQIIAKSNIYKDIWTGIILKYL